MPTPGPDSSSDPLKELGLPAEVRLHSTLLRNNLRGAADLGELSVAVAQANGLAAGLRIGKVITEEQHDQLLALLALEAKSRRELLAPSSSGTEVADPDQPSPKPTLLQDVKASEDWTKDLVFKFPDLPEAVKAHLHYVAALLGDVATTLERQHR